MHFRCLMFEDVELQYGIYKKLERVSCIKLISQR